MVNTKSPSWMDDVTTVVKDSLRFKIKLDIGDDAYASLRMKKHLGDAIDAGLGAVIGVVVAKSSIVASTFFASTGLLAFLAATPIGWVVAAGVFGAGAGILVGRKVHRDSSPRVKKIPDFINTPLDLLAVGLFELIGTLSIKIAAVDGHIHNSERKLIQQYFINEWGYDEIFIQRGVAELERNLDDYSIRSVAENLAKFQKDNPDCNYDSMTSEVLTLLKEVIEADHKIDEREEMSLERVEKIFKKVGAFSFTSK